MRRTKYNYWYPSMRRTKFTQKPASVSKYAWVCNVYNTILSFSRSLYLQLHVHVDRVPILIAKTRMYTYKMIPIDII